MADCYKCGCGISRGAGFRREVKTGHSNRIYYGGRFSASSGNSYGLRTLCPRCAQNYDAKKQLGAIAATVFLLILLVGGYHGQKNRLDFSSASVAIIPSVRVAAHRHRVRGSYSVPAPPAETFVEAYELWVLNQDVTALTDAGGTRELHAGRPIRVTGRAVHELRIRLHDGTTAYVPADMATYKSDWE